jgi:hypothetical protein
MIKLKMRNLDLTFQGQERSNLKVSSELPYIILYRSLIATIVLMSIFKKLLAVKRVFRAITFTIDLHAIDSSSCNSEAYHGRTMNRNAARRSIDRKTVWDE